MYSVNVFCVLGDCTDSCVKRIPILHVPPDVCLIQCFLDYKGREISSVKLVCTHMTPDQLFNPPSDFALASGDKRDAIQKIMDCLGIAFGPIIVIGDVLDHGTSPIIKSPG
jgi:hypothetical protein